MRQMLKKIRVEDNGDTEFCLEHCKMFLDFEEKNSGTDRRRQRSRQRQTG